MQHRRHTDTWNDDLEQAMEGLHGYSLFFGFVLGFPASAAVWGLMAWALS